MAAFFVGQRVRIVGPSESGLTGRVARIICIERANHINYGIGTFCDVDVEGYGRTGKHGYQLSYPPESLEPIIPEGMQPAKWEDCMWQPEGVAA